MLSGPLPALADRLDRRFLDLAESWGAEDLRFGPFVAASVLERIDWFRSFPQLATFAAALDSSDGNLGRFTECDPVDAAGNVRPTALAPITHVLTPAACYHLYDHHQGSHFDRARYFTVRNSCFRRETHYVALERQWSFTMREVVCMGTAAETATFVESATGQVDELVASLGLPVRWDLATDPFFRASSNPRHLMQQVDPTKYELLFDDRLAIASTNLHHDHFGRAFGLTRIDGDRQEPVRTACVAFGLERWLAALIHRFGPTGPWPL